MSDNNKMTGRRIDRDRWDWMDEGDVNTNNPQLIKFIKDMEAAEEERILQKLNSTNQGKSKKSRDDTTAIVGWTIMIGVVLILGMAILTAIKSII